MALAAAKVATKVSLVGGAIYWSVQQGIWGTTKDGSEAGKRLTKVIAPSAGEYVEKIPSVKDINKSAKANWNTGMKTLFTAVSQLPESAEDLTKQAKSAITDSSVDWNHVAMPDPQTPEVSKATEMLSEKEINSKIEPIRSATNLVNKGKGSTTKGAKLNNKEHNKSKPQNVKKKSKDIISPKLKFVKRKEVPALSLQTAFINKKKDKHNLLETVGARSTTSVKLQKDHVFPRKATRTFSQRSLSEDSYKTGHGCSLAMLCPTTPSFIKPLETGYKPSFDKTYKNIYGNAARHTSPPKPVRVEVSEHDYMRSVDMLRTLSECSNSGDVFRHENSLVKPNSILQSVSSSRISEDDLAILKAHSIRKSETTTSVRNSLNNNIRESSEAYSNISVSQPVPLESSEALAKISSPEPALSVSAAVKAVSPGQVFITDLSKTLDNHSLKQSAKFIEPAKNKTKSSVPASNIDHSEVMDNYNLKKSAKYIESAKDMPSVRMSSIEPNDIEPVKDVSSVHMYSIEPKQAHGVTSLTKSNVSDWSTGGWLVPSAEIFDSYQKRAGAQHDSPRVTYLIPSAKERSKSLTNKSNIDLEKSKQQKALTASEISLEKTNQQKPLTASEKPKSSAISNNGFEHFKALLKSSPFKEKSITQAEIDNIAVRKPISPPKISRTVFAIEESPPRLPSSAHKPVSPNAMSSIAEEKSVSSTQISISIISGEKPVSSTQISIISGEKPLSSTQISSIAGEKPTTQISSIDREKPISSDQITSIASDNTVSSTLISNIAGENPVELTSISRIAGEKLPAHIFVIDNENTNTSAGTINKNQLEDNVSIGQGITVSKECLLQSSAHHLSSKEKFKPTPLMPTIFHTKHASETISQEPVVFTKHEDKPVSKAHSYSIDHKTDGNDHSPLWPTFLKPTTIFRGWSAAPSQNVSTKSAVNLPGTSLIRMSHFPQSNYQKYEASLHHRGTNKHFKELTGNISPQPLPFWTKYTSVGNSHRMRPKTNGENHKKKLYW